MPIPTPSVAPQRTSIIRDVLSLRLRAVDAVRLVLVGIERTEPAVLVDDALGHLVKGLLRCRIQPVIQLSGTVPLDALVIESVRQLMSEDDAHRSVVNLNVKKAAVKQPMELREALDGGNGQSSLTDTGQSASKNGC